MIRKPQRIAILIDCSHRLLASPIWKTRFDLDSDRNFRARLTGQVCDDFFRDLPGVAPDTRLI